MQFTKRWNLNATGHARYASSANQPSARSSSLSQRMILASSSVWRWEDQRARTIPSIRRRSISSICFQRTSVRASDANCLVEQGMDSLLTRVLQANAPARRFYEALEGQLVPEVEEQFEERGAVLVRVGYGWREMSELLHPR